MGAYLVLLDGRDFGVDSLDASTRLRHQSNTQCISLEGAVDQGINLALNVSRRLGICKCLVCCGLLEATRILDESA